MKPAAGIGTLFFLLSLVFLFQETNDIETTLVTIRNRKLAEAAGGARMAQITDLHISRLGSRERRLQNAIERLDPDVIFITGDLVASDAGIKPCIELIATMTKRRTVIAVLGNNDHSYRENRVDTKLLVRKLREAGARVLRNESVRLQCDGTESPPLYVVGLDDNFLWYDDYFRAMTNVPAHVPKILLAHSPGIVEKIPAEEVDLVLSGHTHGGQIVLPFIGALYTNPSLLSWKRFVAGMYKEGTTLYVNRGIGSAVLPVRLFSRPEITVFKFE